MELRSTVSSKAHRILSLVLPLALLGASTACGTPGEPLPTSVKDPARRAYYEGMRELVDGDYVKATTIFQAVASSPRHVKHAALAKLRLGDALFFQGRYAESAEVFRGFVQQHNADPNIPYARYMIAQSYYERLPGEWFASPPAYEFDQTLTMQTEAELKGFVTTFPTSTYTPSARKMLAETRLMLFRHEMYAVAWYEGLDKWQAVAWRLRDAIEGYPEYGLTDDHVWRLAIAWDKVGNRTEAARAFGLYLVKFPSGKHAGDAKARLDVLNEALKVEPPKPPAPKPDEPKLEPAPKPEPAEPPSETPPDEDEDVPDKLELRPPTLPPAPDE